MYNLNCLNGLLPPKIILYLLKLLRSAKTDGVPVSRNILLIESFYTSQASHSDCNYKSSIQLKYQVVKQAFLTLQCYMYL